MSAFPSTAMRPVFQPNVLRVSSLLWGSHRPRPNWVRFRSGFLGPAQAGSDSGHGFWVVHAGLAEPRERTEGNGLLLGFGEVAHEHGGRACQIRVGLHG